jgi:hypothetical protein
MSSIYPEVPGSFADLPAIIRINGASSDSTISLPFLHSCNVPRSVSNHNGVVVESTSGPARVPTVNGWFNSRQTFRPVYVNEKKTSTDHFYFSICLIYIDVATRQKRDSLQFLTT